MVCANFGHRQALLSEEGSSEADGWCLEIRTAIIYCTLCRLRAGTPSVSFADSSLHLREPRFVLISRLSKKPSIIYNSQFLIIANKGCNSQYLLASLNWREVAREARRREFPTAAAVYNQFIIPKEFTLFF